MASATSVSEEGPAELVLRAVAMLSLWHYFVGLAAAALVFIYVFLELHFVGYFLRGFRGDPVTLTVVPSSDIFHGVVSKCRILRGRYLVTPWLASPHLQTIFIGLFGRSPDVSYRRQLFSVRDGGTIALDWLLCSEVRSGFSGTLSKDDSTPIVIIVPGLTSDSACPYIKHMAHKIATDGWNVVVSNHRGLGGVSITSDCFYNAGWTEDLREITNHIHQEYPIAPLFAVGTSIGANILVKYLGEEGENTPFAGAVSICSPWDLVVCDRFISRKLVQRFYDRALTIGLQGYANLHQPILTRLANWEGIRKSRSIRDFDIHATCLVGKFETVDTYYRHCSSVSFVRSVSVPLLCISALDDPLCTKEAIPWDECRMNKKVVLATVPHGGHLAFFQGIDASTLWWVEATAEFLQTLRSTPFMHKQVKVHIPADPLLLSLDSSSIDKTPFVNVMDDGTIVGVAQDRGETSGIGGGGGDPMPFVEDSLFDGPHRSEGGELLLGDEIIADKADSPVIQRSLSRLVRQSRKTLWLLVYIAVVTTWPGVGFAVYNGLRRKMKNSRFLMNAWLRR